MRTPLTFVVHDVDTFWFAVRHIPEAPYLLRGAYSTLSLPKAQTQPCGLLITFQLPPLLKGTLAGACWGLRNLTSELAGQLGKPSSFEPYGPLSLFTFTLGEP